MSTEGTEQSNGGAQSVRVSPVPPAGVGQIASTASHPAGHQTVKIGHALHSALRGRYHWALIWGLLLGGLLGGIGWKFARPVFRSEGLVHIAYTMPKVKVETDLSAAIPMFDTFMTTQRLMIQSRRVIDLAIQDPIWKANQCQVPADPERFFAEHLTVETRSRSELIQIVITAPDAATAGTAVTAMVNAYREVYDSQEKHIDHARNSILEDDVRDLTAKRDALNDEVDRIAQEDFGDKKLDFFFDAAAANVARLQAARNSVKMQITGVTLAQEFRDPPEASHKEQSTTAPATTAEAPVVSSPPAVSAHPSAPVLSAEQIAFKDAPMRAYLDVQAHSENQVNEMLARGYGENNPRLITARRIAAQDKEKAEKYAQMYREYNAVTAQNLGDGRGIQTAGKTITELKAVEVALEKLLKEAKDELKILGAKKSRLEKKSEELLTMQRKLDGWNDRLDDLKSEGLLGGRLSVYSPGNIPVSPERDNRYRLGGAGVGVGLFLPGILMVLNSLWFRRKYRYSDDAGGKSAAQAIPLLGILPVLDEHCDDPEEMNGASYSVHQIRVTLRSQAQQGRSAAYLITSSTSGEGKTSLTMSLGLSLAASKLRTLIVDADLVGRSLSRNLRATDLQGFSEALTDGTLRDKLRKVAEGLAILPAGKIFHSQGCAVSPAAARTILEEARGYFDVVLVDTGPLLGSLEAAVLAQEVDGVIFTIARGQQRKLVERALQRLNSLGSKVVGMVFNRARADDFYSSAYSSTSISSGSPDHSAEITTALAKRHKRLADFGPLVQAVAAGVPIGAQN